MYTIDKPSPLLPLNSARWPHGSPPANEILAAIADGLTRPAGACPICNGLHELDWLRQRAGADPGAASGPGCTCASCCPFLHALRAFGHADDDGDDAA